MEKVNSGIDLDPSSFFDAFYPKLYRVVSIVSAASPEDIKDLVQQALLISWQRKAEFRGDSSIESWILGIVRNLVRRKFRDAVRERRASEAVQALATLEAADLTPAQIQSAEAGRRVRRALSLMDPTYVQALRLRYQDGRSIRQIAEELGATEKGIESRLARAREALRDRLREDQDDVDL